MIKSTCISHGKSGVISIKRSGKTWSPSAEQTKSHPVLQELDEVFIKPNNNKLAQKAKDLVTFLDYGDTVQKFQEFYIANPNKAFYVLILFICEAIKQGKAKEASEAFKTIVACDWFDDARCFMIAHGISVQRQENLQMFLIGSQKLRDRIMNLLDHRVHDACIYSKEGKKLVAAMSKFLKINKQKSSKIRRLAV